MGTRPPLSLALKAASMDLPQMSSADENGLASPRLTPAAAFTRSMFVSSQSIILEASEKLPTLSDHDKRNENCEPQPLQKSISHRRPSNRVSGFSELMGFPRIAKTVLWRKIVRTAWSFNPKRSFRTNSIWPEPRAPNSFANTKVVRSTLCSILTDKGLLKLRSRVNLYAVSQDLLGNFLSDGSLRSSSCFKNQPSLWRLREASGNVAESSGVGASSQDVSTNARAIVMTRQVKFNILIRALSRALVARQHQSSFMLLR